MKALPPPQVKRLAIQGQVTLKRKSHWVKRYATVQNCIFSYRTAQSDKTAKYTVDLRTSKVMLG